MAFRDNVVPLLWGPELAPVLVTKSPRSTAYRSQNLLADKHLKNSNEKPIAEHHAVRVFCEDLA